jgi:hypothetical protein
MTPNRFDVINDLGKVLVTIPEEYIPEHRAYLAQLFSNSETLYNESLKLRTAYLDGNLEDVASAMRNFCAYMNTLQHAVFSAKRKERDAVEKKPVKAKAKKKK